MIWITHWELSDLRPTNGSPAQRETIPWDQGHHKTLFKNPCYITSINQLLIKKIWLIKNVTYAFTHTKLCICNITTERLQNSKSFIQANQHDNVVIHK